ncbi:MAG: hypothetical protein FJ138_13490, partial [Deltaproteobacteria bacterium]|nr:hypothetical protein [Deltaproteobacteria bacterium]
MTPLGAKVFQLKPYPTQERGGRSVAIGVAALLMAAFNLSLAPAEGPAALAFAALFAVVGAQRLRAGLRLRALPPQARAYRVSPEGLFKTLEGRDLARLDLRAVRALWLSEGREALYLLTPRGLQTLSAEELERAADWERLTLHLERCVSATLWAQGEAAWREAQARSHALRGLRGAPTPAAVRLIALCALSLPLSAL